MKGVTIEKKKFIRAVSCLSVVLMAGGTAFAQQGKMQSGLYNGPMAPHDGFGCPGCGFFTNLEANACTGCNYSADNGYLLLGPNNCFAPGATQWISYPFVATRLAVRTVTLAVTDSGFCVATSTRFTVAIYNDNVHTLPARRSATQ